MGRRRKLVLPVKLTPAQKKLHESKARFRIVKAGRRFGKTHYAAFWLVKRALEKPGRHWAIAKTSGLSTDEFWERFQALVPRQFVESVDSRRHRMKLVVGNMRSELACATAEREDNLRGRGLTSVVIDEASFVTPTLFDTIVRPMLIDTNAPALIISSPKTGWFTQTWEKAKRGELEDWEAFHFSIYDNSKKRGGILDEKEIDGIKATCPEYVWKSEYLAEESDDTGIVYSMFSKENIFDPSHRFTDFKSYPTVVGIDWGVKDDTAAVWLSVSPEGYVVIGEEHSKNGLDVDKHSGIIRRLSRDYERLTPKDHVISHDAFRNHKDSRDSIAETFARSGIICSRSTRDLNSSINRVMSFVGGADSVPWLYVSNHCTRLIRAFQSWEWREHEIDLLQALRYGLEEICRRGLTPYSRFAASYTGYSRPGLAGNLDNTPTFGVDPSTPRLDAKARKGLRWSFGDNVEYHGFH